MKCPRAGSAGTESDSENKVCEVPDMHRFFIPRAFQERMTITGQDAHHMMDVLRMKPGDVIQIASDDGVRALAEITELERGCVTVRVTEVLAESHEPSVSVTLLQGLAKGEKMEQIIQKAVEIGAAGIIPVAMRHCVVQLDAGRAEKKTERWQKIAESAAKQSKRDMIPRVFPVMDLSGALKAVESDLILVAYESEDRQSLKSVLQSHPEAKRMLLVIGPEGGLSGEEVELAAAAGAFPVSLGRRILRTETAGLVALSAILYETDNLGI